MHANGNGGETRKRGAGGARRWAFTLAQARAAQARGRARVVAHDDLDGVRFIAGTDVGLERRRSVVRGAVVVLSYPELELCDQATARRPATFPYVPGYLSFREIPVLLDAIALLDTLPDLIVCDGQGYAHPRRFGLACHLGVATGIATIGAAKSRLVGQHDEPAIDKGAHVPLTDAGEIIGAVVRTRRGARPLYVSVGHRVSLASAIRFVLACCPRYRLPETTRRAHQLASVP